MVQRTGPMKRLYDGPMIEAGRGADFLQLSPASAPARGLTSWLAGAIRAAVIDGRLPAGSSLPPTRLLAGDLGVSRGVVVEAYAQLVAEGYLIARPGDGTRVAEGLAQQPPAGQPGQDQQDQARHRVPQRLGGEHRRAG